MKLILTALGFGLAISALAQTATGTAGSPAVLPIQYTLSISDYMTLSVNGTAFTIQVSAASPNYSASGAAMVVQTNCHFAVSSVVTSYPTLSGHALSHPTAFTSTTSFGSSSHPPTGRTPAAGNITATATGITSSDAIGTYTGGVVTVTVTDA